MLPVVLVDVLDIFNEDFYLLGAQAVDPSEWRGGLGVSSFIGKWGMSALNPAHHSAQLGNSPKCVLKHFW